MELTPLQKRIVEKVASDAQKRTARLRKGNPDLPTPTETVLITPSLGVRDLKMCLEIPNHIEFKDPYFACSAAIKILIILDALKKTIPDFKNNSDLQDAMANAFAALTYAFEKHASGSWIEWMEKMGQDPTTGNERKVFDDALLAWGDQLESIGIGMDAYELLSKGGAQQSGNQGDEGEWLTPTTKSDLANRMGNVGTKKATTMLKQYGLKQAGNRQLWTVRLDKMPPNIRKKLEKN